MPANDAPQFPDYSPLWGLDPAIDMLNHGSFGACPTAVLAEQSRLRAGMEAAPVRFLVQEMEPRWDASRARLAAVVGADPADLVFVRNATEGVNAVLRSLRFLPGDEILVTNHGYNACSNAARFVAERCGAAVVAADVPFPLDAPEQVGDAVLAAVTPRTRLALLDHITSPTGLVFPIAELTRRLAERGVDVLVDGAHAPGMVPLDLGTLGAAYYAGNCHKWLCAPKGVGFLHVRRDRQDGVHPAVISHGRNTRRPGRSLLHDEFDWTGTDDPTPQLCVGAAIDFLDALPGGLPALMARNRALALHARDILATVLAAPPPCPDSMIGALAALPLPDDADPAALDRAVVPSPIQRLQRDLRDRHGLEVPLHYWPGPPRRLVRISAQAYNRPAQYRRLAAVLQAGLFRGREIR